MQSVMNKKARLITKRAFEYMEVCDLFHFLKDLSICILACCKICVQIWYKCAINK